MIEDPGKAGPAAGFPSATAAELLGGPNGKLARGAPLSLVRRTSAAEAPLSHWTVTCPAQAGAGAARA